MVSVPAFYSDDPSSNPAGYLINFLYEKTKINEKEAGVGPIFKNKHRKLYIESFDVWYIQTNITSKIINRIRHKCFDKDIHIHRMKKATPFYKIILFICYNYVQMI